MQESTEPLIDAATQFQDLLIERATSGGQPGDEQRFQSLRSTLLGDPLTAVVVPSFVKHCRTIDQYWQFIKGKFETYKMRKAFIWEQFQPLFSKLENCGAASETAASTVSELNFTNPEPLITTLARVFAQEGAATEVAVLANSKASIEQTGYDNWNGGSYTFTLYLELPYQIYTQLGDRRERIEKDIFAKATSLLRAYPKDNIGQVQITAELSTDPSWREKAKAWVDGKHINNQGRVRSDNIASRQCDGLLFRSQSEIHLYNALKAAGVSFAPLPVFVRGGQGYQRIEPDFVILKDGLILVVEVDGDTVHHETPAEAHARTTMLAHEGAHIERVRAAECETPEKAKLCTQKVLTALSKLKASK